MSYKTESKNIPYASKNFSIIFLNVSYNAKDKLHLDIIH